MENKDLEKIVQIFLDRESTQEQLMGATNSLLEIFERFSCISITDDPLESEYSKNTKLDSGVAISPLGAADCINQYLRTTKFLRGINDAINDLLDKFKDEKIHLLYAGTGPYATLVSPLLHLFDSNRIEVSFLDIHQKSLDSVKSVLNGLGLNGFVKDYICEDATKYVCSSKVHMIITETMRFAFEGEPQVNITLNLLPQLCDGGVFIPKSVNIYLENLPRNITQEISLKKDINLTQYLAEIIKFDSQKEWNRKNFILTPYYQLEEDLKDESALYLSTQIEVYEDHILNKNESSLNLIAPLFLSKEIYKGDVLEFSYEFENKPEILYKHISNNTKIYK